MAITEENVYVELRDPKNQIQIMIFNYLKEAWVQISGFYTRL